MPLSDPAIYIPPLDRQVGGDHFKKYAIQPVEFAERNRLPYCLANAFKYLVRHADKNGRQDLEKAAHYCELGLDLYPKVKEHFTAAAMDTWAILPGVFLQANAITGRRAAAIKHLLSVYTEGMGGYLRAKAEIEAIIAEEYK
jgi:hypothetical protein